MSFKLQKNNSFYIILSCITITSFIFVVSLSNVKSLWYDDIYQIYFSWNRSFLETLGIVLEVDLNPPLWAVLSHLWLRIAPFGTGWLKLPSILFVSMAIFVVGLIGKELFGKKVGIISALLFALSPIMTLDCAYSFRAYGLYLFASALIVYAYIRKIKNPSVPNRIFFGAAVFLIAFTHYFGALICVFLGIADLILVFLKKQKPSFFIEYVSVAFVELFWFIPQLTTINSALSSFWPSRPTLRSFINAVKYLMFDSSLLTLAFFASVIFFAVALVKEVKKTGVKHLTETTVFCKLTFLLIPLFYILLIFIYSNIKPESSVWVNRYFFSLYPMLILFFASNLFDTYERLANRSANTKKSVTVVSILLILTLLIPNYVVEVVRKVNTEYEPFEEVAEIIVSRPEVSNGEDVLVINTTNCGKGWDYYLTKNNSRDISNIKTMDLLSYSHREIVSYDTVFLYAVHFDGSFSLDKIREEISQTHIETIIDIEKNIFKYEKKK